MAKKIKNTTGADVAITDIGITIPASSTYSLSVGDYPTFEQSTDLQTLINAGTLVGNDGLSDLTIAGSLQMFQRNDSRIASNDPATRVAQAGAASITLTANSQPVMIFYGTVGDQTLTLPDARTCNVGKRYWVQNISTKNIIVKNNGASTIATIERTASASFITLQDNSTANGTWVFSWECVVNGGILAKNFSLQFGRAGAINNTTKLAVANTCIASGLMIPGNAILTGWTITNNADPGGEKYATFTLQRKTGVSTWTDIAGTDLTINGGYRSAQNNNLWVDIGSDWEIQPYRSAGDATNITDATAILTFITYG